MRFLERTLCLLVVLLVTPASGAGLRYPQFPPLPAPPADAANPPTRAKRLLGLELFFDTSLSHSGSTSCSNCHVYNTQFQDNLVKPRPDTSQGSDFFTLPFNTESLLNIAYRRFFFRDGRHTDLALAMSEPWIEDNQQLGPTRALAATALAGTLRSKPGYVRQFRTAFGSDITKLADEDVFDLAGKALAVFVRQVVTRPTPFDRWNARQGKMPPAAERGAALFVGKARCALCHVGPNFTDNDFHNVSSSLPDVNGHRADEGRARVTGLAADGGKFLTPTMRQVVTTAPYFHDGSAVSLLDVLNHLDAGAGGDPNHDARVGTPLGLTAAEKADLAAFLQTLRGPAVVLRGPDGPLCGDAEVAAFRRKLPR
jgi:cytochrome c peroxidase